MGPYLAQPNIDVKSDKGESQQTKIRYSRCDMQGWRRNMEDATIAEVDIGNGNSLFGVFDGHGGTSECMQASKSQNWWRHCSWVISVSPLSTKRESTKMPSLTPFAASTKL